MAEIPAINIFLMKPPEEDEKKSFLVEMLRQQKEDMFRESLLAQMAEMSHKLPSTSHVGGG
jgi:hypothetical protein